MATKPTTVPRWARTAAGADAANITVPSSGEEDIGWTNGQNPVSSGKMNWLFNWLTKWLFYVQDAVFTATAASGLPGVSGTGDGAAAGGAFTGGATNGPGVTGQGTGTGAGATIIGGASAGRGATITGGAGGDGIVASGGTGGGIGGQFTGTSSSRGAVVTGGANADAALVAVPQGNSIAINATGATRSPTTVVAYSATITLSLILGNDFSITATNGTAFTINPTLTAVISGQRFTVRIRNTSGGALGVATWNASFKMAAWTQPLNGFSRSIDFMYDGTNLIEVSRTPADVPN